MHDESKKIRTILNYSKINKLFIELFNFTAYSYFFYYKNVSFFLF
ncbi:hypothetical protein GMMP1_410013 [Candidatus Magnetomoraceae bacterium gMMP-1]